MIRPLRRAHGRAWLALAFVLPATLWVSLGARGVPPAALPAHSNDEQVTILDRQVELRLPTTFLHPDVLVYAVAGNERHLAGRLTGLPVERLPLPEGTKTVELFSLAHQRTLRRFERKTP